MDVRKENYPVSYILVPTRVYHRNGASAAEIESLMEHLDEANFYDNNLTNPSFSLCENEPIHENASSS